MITYCLLNGALTPKDTAALHVSDLAILRGFGIFDYNLIRKGTPLFFDQYLDRFFRSAAHMELEVPFSKEEIKEQIKELLAANGHQETGALRLVMTGGYAADSYTPGKPNLVILQHAFKAYPEEWYTKGIKLLTHDYQRECPEAKTINYVTGIRMLKALKAQKAQELLYHHDGQLREATRSNVFLVTADNIVVTPAREILKGITRAQMLATLPAHYTLEVRDVEVAELRTAKEVFLTGSNKKIMPVRQVDDVVYGDPGPVSRHCMQLFEEHTQAYLEAVTL